MKIRNVLENIMSALGYEVLSGKYELIKVSKIRKLNNVWKDPTLPDKQYKIVKEQLENLRISGILENPFKPAVDLIKQTHIKSPTLLEIGCSSGYYNEVFKLAGLKVNYSGCDYSPSFIALARKLYPSIEFRIEDATALKYKKKQFQIGLSGCCILHIKDYEKAIAETARVSSEYMIFHRTPVIHTAKTTYFQKVGYGIEMMEIFFNESELIMLFAKYGFGLVGSITLDQSQINGLKDPVFIKSYLLKRYK